MYFIYSLLLTLKIPHTVPDRDLHVLREWLLTLSLPTQDKQLAIVLDEVEQKIDLSVASGSTICLKPKAEVNNWY